MILQKKSQTKLVDYCRKSEMEEGARRSLR